MGLRVITFRESGSDTDDGALLYCSTSGRVLELEAFADEDDARTFLLWLEEDKDIAQDPRSIDSHYLNDLQAEWFTLSEES